MKYTIGILFLLLVACEPDKHNSQYCQPWRLPINTEVEVFEIAGEYIGGKMLFGRCEDTGKIKDYIDCQYLIDVVCDGTMESFWTDTIPKEWIDHKVWELNK